MAGKAKPKTKSRKAKKKSVKKRTGEKPKAESRKPKGAAGKKTAAKKAEPPPPLDDETLRAPRIRSERVAKYTQFRLDGMHKQTAIRKAGFDPKNRRNANAMACRLDKMLMDKGIMLEALIECGVNQLTLAETLSRALDCGDVRTELQAVRTVVSMLDYDKPAQEDPEDPAAGAEAFDDRAAIAGRISEVLARRRAEADA